MAILDRLGQRVEHALRQFAVQQEMEAVIAIACAGPFPLTALDRSLQRLVGRAGGEIEQGRRAAVEGGAADLLRRRAQQIFVAARKRYRRTAMDVRIDPARDDDLTRGVDDAGSADRRQAPRTSDRCNLAVLDTDISCLGAARQHRLAAGNDQIEHAPAPYAARTALRRRLTAPGLREASRRRSVFAPATMSHRALRAPAETTSSQRARFRRTGFRH